MRSVWKASRQIGMISGKPPGTFDRLPFSWNVLGVIVVGIMLAKWTWLLLAPREMSAMAPNGQRHSAAAENLFRATTAAGTNSALSALRNVQLTGVFAGSPGFAVLKLEGNKQVGVPLGGEVVHGIKLVKIAPDHVVIAGDGIRQRIDLEWSRKSGAANREPAARIEAVRRQLLHGAAH